MPELPKTVYVRWYEEGDDQWLTAEESIEGHAEKNETRLVGVYELKEVVSVELEVKERIISKTVA